MIATSNKIKIIIPAYNADDTIEKCVEAICKAVCFLEYFEIVVVDNGSNNNLNELAKKYTVQIIHHCDFASAAYARNSGAHLFTEGIFVFIDSDVIIEKDCLIRLIKPIIDGQEVATIGNYSTDVRGLNFPQRYKQLYIHHIYSKSNGVIKNDFWTAISAINSTVFHELNGFDCSFMGANGEDQEFGIRLTKHGYSVASITRANGKHINPYTVKKLMQNDLKKGITAMSNSLKNQIPLKDNRHAKRRSIYAVFFATIFIPSLFLSFLDFHFIYLSFFFLIIWFLLRLNLTIVFFKNQNAIFTIKSIALTYILDIVRFTSVIIGFYKNIKSKAQNKSLILNQ